MTYHFYHYSQLGDYECPHCGFKRPTPDYDASQVSLTDGLSFQVGENTIKANYRGFYNVYNILAVYGAASMAGIPLSQFNRILGDYTPQFGRNELFEINDTKVLLNLAKNPAGFNQNISAVMTDQTPKDIIILINDNSQGTGLMFPGSGMWILTVYKMQMPLLLLYAENAVVTCSYG